MMNETFILWLGLPSTLLRYENGAFHTPALSFHVDSKHLENPGADHAAPIMSLCHGIFTDGSMFRLLFPRKRSILVYMTRIGKEINSAGLFFYNLPVK